MNQVLAQIKNPGIPRLIGEGGTEQGSVALGILLSRIFSALFLLAFITAFLYLITGAMHWITSGGDKTKLEEARNRIIHSIVGIVVVASSFAIISLVGQFIGLDLENLPIPTIK